MEWAAEIEFVKSRRVDVMHGMMGWLEPRTKIINMTDPIYYVGATIAQKKSTNWSALNDLTGKTIATMQGFASVDELKSIPNAELKLYDTSDAAIRDLVAGRIDALFADPPLAQYTLSQNSDWALHAVAVKQPYDPKYAILTGKYMWCLGSQRRRQTS